MVSASTGLISVVGVLFLMSQFLLLDLSQVSEGRTKVFGHGLPLRDFSNGFESLVGTPSNVRLSLWRFLDLRDLDSALRLQIDDVADRE